MSGKRPHIAVIGAGIGGLAAALRLSGRADVTVMDAGAAPGGKMRQFETPAGPADGGPTVLTMLPVFEALFANVGERLHDHVQLTPDHILARHVWSDGAQLDLTSDLSESIANVRAFAGPSEARAFAEFNSRAQALFRGFDAPMMQSATPNLASLTAHVLENPRLALKMAPFSTLSGLLAQTFRDPRLRQLFGRYATYVGGAPGQVPALLSLIWASEAAGVWSIAGGMQRLAQAIADLAAARGAAFHMGSLIDRIELQGGRVAGIVDSTGGRMACDAVVFNGDPQALSRGLLGAPLRKLLPASATGPRSFSAYVWHFAAEAHGLPLAHHNVFFADRTDSEFPELIAGHMPTDPTLYICAQDRGGTHRPEGVERFEIIMNGPPGQPAPKEEFAQCQTRVFDRLEAMGLRLSPRPGRASLTTPTDFAARFPGSDGSLYGRSPAGMMAAFQRPTARTKIPGLYLAGGGTHPGAGVPMACLSGRHAAEAISADLALTSTCRPTATPGGMSTGSARMAAAPSPSSAS